MIKSISKLSQLILLLVLCFKLQAQEISIHISPFGNDQQEGTKENPVASIARAVQLVKELKTKQISDDTITVILHEGVYRLKQGIVLNAEDSGSEKYPIIYKSKEGEKVVISGAVPIDNYKLISHDHFLYKKDPEIGNKIIEIDLRRANISEFKPIRLSGFGGNEKPQPYILNEIYFNGKAMSLSRWPNKGFSEFTGVFSDSSGIEKLTAIHYEDDHISGWKNEPNIILHGYWKYLWADAYEHVSVLDTTYKLIWLKPPYNHYKFEKNRPFAAFNVIAEIDQPGEWAYNYKTGKVYFYPPENPSGGNIQLSTCKESLLAINNAKWISFSGITFEMGAAGGIQITNSNHISVINCVVHACTRDGVVMKGGNNNTISSCEIYDLGRGGIHVSGGNRETLEKSNFHIDNCHIHKLSRIDRTYTPGIWVDGVGTTITHCKIHDVPSSAMRINGNDHIVEFNEMYHVVTESDDQGAIDMWGDPTYRGNVFRYNYIHDTGPLVNDEINAHCGRAGIRLDDAISGNLVYGNIFKNCSGGSFGAIQIHGGKENLIQNNLFYQCENGISFTPWRLKQWKSYNKKSLEFFEKNKELYTQSYPNLVNINKNMNTNTIIQNVFLECENTSIRKPKVVVFERNLEVDKNPGFDNPENEKYGIDKMPESLKMIKFEAIPFEKIGLKNLK